MANVFLDETRGYITPGALFVYVPGQLGRPVTVTIELHPGGAPWRRVSNRSGTARRTPPRGRLDVLYGSPILMGNLETLPAFAIKGVPHRFVGYALGEFDRRQSWTTCRAVVEAGTEIVGDIPYKAYTFIGIGPGRGGIEHLNSTTIPFSGIGTDRASRIRTLAFLARRDGDGTVASVAVVSLPKAACPRASARTAGTRSVRFDRMTTVSPAFGNR